MPRGKKQQRKIRVTKAQVREIQEERKKKTKGRKNRIIPGPWTEIEPGFTVSAKLRWSKTLVGDPLLGTYVRDEMWCEKSWYPITLNVTSKDIRAKVKKHGLDNYLAAVEKSLNSKTNVKKYGRIVILAATADHSQREEEDRRFISCRGKTNKKSISGFAAFRSRWQTQICHIGVRDGSTAGN